MTDRPTNDQSAQPAQDGGWRILNPSGPATGETENAPPSAPDETASASEIALAQTSDMPAEAIAAGWRAPENRQAVVITPADAPRRAWRIPTLPKDLQSRPSEHGGWFRPANTLLTEADESVVISDEAPSADAVPVDPTEVAVLPHDGDLASADVLPLENQAVDEVEVLPFEGEDAKSDADTDTSDDEEDEDDADRISMSQLVSLATLAENTPSIAVEVGEPDAAAMDAEAYAREQIERLRSLGVGEEEVEAEAEEEAPAEPGGPLTPEEQALAEKFHRAEDRVRALREQYRSGQLTKDDFNAALKREMVLGADGTWWMLGTNTDVWYHFVNDKWLAEEPPVFQREREAAGMTSPGAASVYATLPTAGLQGDMPLPLAVPTRDPDETLVGTDALYLDPSLQPTMAVQSLDATIPMGSADPTLQSAAIGGDYVPPAAIPSAYTSAADVPNFAEAVQRQQSSTLRLIAIIAAVGIGLFLLLGACGAILIATTYNGLVSPFQSQIAGLANYQPDFQTARIYAADGSTIATLIGRGDRQPVTLTEVSPNFVHAVLSVEDPDFYETAGFSAIGVAGGIVQNALGSGGGAPRGITEQIACGLVIQDCSNTPENNRSIFAVSSELARTYDANFLLELYINEIFLGNQSYGVGSAAQFYFRTSATNLTTAQAALIAGLIDGPATFDPVVNREASFARMNQVLQIQAQVGCIQFQFAPYLTSPFCVTPEQIASGQIAVEKAQVEASNFNPRQNDDRYPHFVNYVLAQIEQVYGTNELFQRGFQIYTTLVPSIQDAAQGALVAGITGVSSRGVNNGAVLVADTTTGAIRAMVGSPNFDDANIQGEVNNVFTWQPPGDAIFPIIYTAALEGVTNGQGVFQYMTSASTLWNVPTTFSTNPPFTPQNPNNIFSGPTAVRFALGNSFNVAAAKAYEFIGDQAFINASNRMGIDYLGDASFGLPASQGTNSVRLYDMVEAYATLANNGNRVPLNAIVRITDSAGVEVPYLQPRQPSQQVQPQAAFIISNILADDSARSTTFGPNSGLNIGNLPGAVAVKTGTSSGAADLWTLGYSSTQVVGVWTGSTNNGATSASVMQSAVPIWNSIMRTALGTSNPRFSQPGGIVQAQICSLTGALFDPAVSQNCGSVRTEIFSQNGPPLPPGSGFVTTVTIDTWSGLTANQYCPDNTTTGQFMNVSDPAAVQWLQSAQGQVFLQQNGITNLAGYQVPAQCTINAQNPILSISSPTTGQTLQGSINVLGTVQAAGLSQFTLEVAPQSQPNSFTLVSGPSTTPVQNGTLGTFDTTRFPNGAYILRLAAFNTANGFAYRTVPVVINNPLPTPTPTIQAIMPTIIVTFPPQILPTDPILGFPTPIPFDQPTPTINFNS